MFWLVPMPDVEKSSLPGFLRISPSNSAAVLNGESLRTKQMYGLISMSESIANSFHLYCSLDSSAGSMACVAMRARTSASPAGAAPAGIAPATFPLPTLGPVLRAVLAELLEGRGFIMLRGLPVERWASDERAIACMGIGSWLGRPRSQNAKGHLLGHVKDLGLDIRDSNVRYYQTNRRLEYHTDSVDIVALLCLKAAKSGGESYLASSITLYNEMLARRKDLLPALFEPFPTDRRGEVPGGMKPWFDIPIYHWYAEKLSCIYVRQYIESAQKLFPEATRLTRAQIAAMDLLDDLCNDAAIHLSMDFRPGDIQLLHNHQILHSRADLENWPEPEP